MSETRLYLVDRAGDVLPHATFANAWGGAMAIWRLLSKKHLGLSGVAFTMMLYEDEMRPLIRAAQEGKCEPWETMVLMTTMDKVIIPTEHVSAVALALQKFSDEHEAEAVDFVFHVGAQARALRKYLEKAAQEGWRGVCWNQTSVSQVLWDGVRLTDEEMRLYDEDGPDLPAKWDAETRPYNIDKDNGGHWFWPEIQR